VKVIEPKASAKPEPVSKRFIKTLVHSERTANVTDVRFAPDGSKLFAAGYPSGLVQLFDTKTWKEIRRIQTPPGYRGTAEYALLTPDWQTLYVPVDRRKVVATEKDGKKQRRIEYNGELLAWDVATGKELPAIKPSVPERGVMVGYISPTGDKLVAVEYGSYLLNEEMVKETVLWDLKSQTAELLGKAYGMAAFSGDGRRLAIALFSTPSQESRLFVMDSKSGRELFTVKSVNKGRGLSWPHFSPDGKILAVEDSAGRIDQPATLKLFDGQSGKELASFDSGGKYPFRTFAFSPDSSRLAATDFIGKLWIWNMSTKKEERTYALPGIKLALRVTFSPDSKRLAVLAQPEWSEAEVGSDPDPADIPQPRVFLFELGRESEPEVVMCPHGYCGGLAFSPDGKTLAAGGAGGVHLFDLTK
jgi:WD40 repeat protein